MTSLLRGTGRSLLGRGGAAALPTDADHLFRDRFVAPVGSLGATRDAEYNGGWDVTGGSAMSVVNGALRIDSGAAIADYRLNGQDGIARANGRTFACVVIPEDAHMTTAAGLASSATEDNPSTDGHHLILDGSLAVGTPGAKVTVTGTAGSSKDTRPMEYLAMVAMFADGTAYLLSALGDDTGTPLGGRTDPYGIPAYPSARIVWWHDGATPDPVYPFLGAGGNFDYPLGALFDDARVVDVAAWASADGIAGGAADRFNRANSTTDPGPLWSGGGQWGIQSNRLYNSSAGASTVGWLGTPALSADMIWCFDVITGSNAAAKWEVRLRQSGGNYVSVTNDSTNNTIKIQPYSANVLQSNIFSTALAWANSTTYRMVVMAKGNQYNVFRNGVSVTGGWVTDASNWWLAQVGFRFVTHTPSQGPVYDNFIALPWAVTVPAEIQAGTVPVAPTVGATVATDDGSGSNGASISGRTTTTGSKTWTQHSGTITVSSNAFVEATGSEAVATIDAGTPDVEIEATVTSPAADGDSVCGIAFAYTDANTCLFLRLFKSAAQPGAHEVELIHIAGGIGLGGSGIVKKSHLGTYVGSSQAVVLKAQKVGRRVHCFVDGEYRLGCELDRDVTGTRAGVFFAAADGGSVIDALTWKALT